MNLSIVVPVYNSEAILSSLVQEINKQVTFVEQFELILVNDCSPDASWREIERLQRDYSFIKAINLMKNFSQHNAIMAGVAESKGEVVILMDDDLQHNPSDLKKIYDQIVVEGFDVCYTKFNTKHHTRWKLLGSWFNDRVANLLINKPRDLYFSPFKGMTRQVAELITQYKGPYPYIDGLLLSVTNNISYVEVQHHERMIGEGNYNLIKSISLWTKMATGFSVMPLRFATYTGAILSIFSSLFIFFLVAQKFLVDKMPDGWSTIVVLVLFFGGVQLFSIGIIGEYIGRIYLNINGKKQYIVRDVIDSDK